MKFITISFFIFGGLGSVHAADLDTSSEIRVSYRSSPTLFDSKSNIETNVEILRNDFFRKNLKIIQKKLPDSSIKDVKISHKIELEKISIDLLNLGVDLPGSESIPKEIVNQIAEAVGCTDNLAKDFGYPEGCEQIITRFNPPLIQAPIRKSIVVPYLSFQVDLSITSSKHRVEVDHSYPCKENSEVKVKRSLYVYPYSLLDIVRNPVDGFRLSFEGPDVSVKNSRSCSDFNQVLFSVD